MTTTKVAELITKELLATGATHSCLNCENWSHQLEKCGKFGMVPPPKVIVFSCGENWTADIPF